MVFMRKKAGKLPREEGSDCIFEVGYRGPTHRTDAQQTLARVLIPQNCQPPMSLCHASMTGVWMQHMLLNVTQG